MAKPDEVGYYKQEDLLQVDYTPAEDGLDGHARGFPAGQLHLSGQGQEPEDPRSAEPAGSGPSPTTTGSCQDNWKEIVLDGMAERLKKYRSFKLFMDTCVRCGACADKCHFFIGGGDPKNMPVLRAELLRSIYRNDFTAMGKVLGKLAGGPRADRSTSSRSGSTTSTSAPSAAAARVFCPFGIDTAEITMFGRELLGLLGLYVNWVDRAGGQLLPHSETTWRSRPTAWSTRSSSWWTTSRKPPASSVDLPVQQEGRRGPLHPAVGRLSSPTPGIYTCMGYMLLFHELGLDYTFSTYASEGGNFGLFTSHEMIKRLNSKIYAEAKRLGVKWILGGECGHMWRVLHQYMDTVNGPADFLEVPKSPITGTVFENAKSIKMIHIMEFIADLIRHGKLNLDPSRNDHIRVTFHDSCNPARAMGIFEEPRYVITQRVQPLLRDAGEHDPRADLLLRRRGRTGDRREHGDASARRAAPRQRRQVRAGEARRESTRRHVRHRPGHAGHRVRLLGARRAGDRHHRTGGQRHDLQGREEADAESALGADPGHGRRRGREETPTMNDKADDHRRAGHRARRADVPVLVRACGGAARCRHRAGTCPGGVSASRTNMRAHHMDLLDAVAGRSGPRRQTDKYESTTIPARSTSRSLTKTCLCSAMRRRRMRRLPTRDDGPTTVLPPVPRLRRTFVRPVGIATSSPKGSAAMDESRRSFLKNAGCTALGVGCGFPLLAAAGCGLSKKAHGRRGAARTSQWAMVIDVQKCLRPRGARRVRQGLPPRAQRAHEIPDPGRRGQVDLDGEVRERLSRPGPRTRRHAERTARPGALQPLHESALRQGLPHPGHLEEESRTAS